MPLYNFVCSGCDKHVRKLLSPGKQTSPQACACGAALVRSAGAPSSQTMEVLDNGVMVRRIERPADAQRLMRERAQSDPRMKPPE
jgi:hypothetical protein